MQFTLTDSLPDWPITKSPNWKSSSAVIVVWLATNFKPSPSSVKAKDPSESLIFDKTDVLYLSVLKVLTDRDDIYGSVLGQLVPPGFIGPITPPA